MFTCLLRTSLCSHFRRV